MRNRTQNQGSLTPNLAALTALQNQAQNQGSFAPNLAALAALRNQAQNPSSSTTACDSSNLDINALLLDPNIRNQIISRLMQLRAQFQPSLANNLTPSPTRTPSSSTSPPSALPALPAGLPPNLLENPQVQEFIRNNPEIVQRFATEGLPSPDKVLL